MKIFYLLPFLLIAVLILSGCSSPQPDSNQDKDTNQKTLPDQKEEPKVSKSFDQNLVYKWMDNNQANTRPIELRADGTWTDGIESGQWWTEDITNSDWEEWVFPTQESYIDGGEIVPTKKLVMTNRGDGTSTGPIDESELLEGWVDFIWITSGKYRHQSQDIPRDV